MTFSAFDDHQATSVEQNWKRKLEYQYPRHMRLQSPSLSQKPIGITLNDSLIASPVKGPPIIPKKSLGETCSIPLKQPSKVVSNTLTKTHIENIRRSLERRLEIAKNQGNHQLIGLLEEESQYLLSF